MTLLVVGLRNEPRQVSKCPALTRFLYTCILMCYIYLSSERDKLEVIG